MITLLVSVEVLSTNNNRIIDYARSMDFDRANETSMSESIVLRNVRLNRKRSQETYAL